MDNSRSLVATPAGSTPWLDKNGTEMVDILLGCPEVLCRISKRKLLKHVPSFEALLDDNSTARLPDVGCEEFDILMEYVDSDCTSIRPLIASRRSEIEMTMSWEPIPIFILAERLALPVLQNLIMDTLIDYDAENRTLPSLEMAREIYRGIKSGSTMSRYCVHGIYLGFQLDDREDIWPTAGLGELLHDDKTFATDFLDLVRRGKAKDPRKMERTLFQTSLSDSAVERAMTPVDPAPLFNTSPSSRPAELLSKKRHASSETQPSRRHKKKKRHTNPPESVDLDKNRDRTPAEGAAVGHEVLTKQPLTEVDGNAGSSIPHIASKKACAGVTDDGAKVYTILNGERENQEGMHVKDLAQRTGLTVNEVFKAGESLLEGGWIQTKVDTATWAVTDIYT